jgi:hypothetical protein
MEHAMILNELDMDPFHSKNVTYKQFAENTE